MVLNFFSEEKYLAFLLYMLSVVTLLNELYFFHW